MNCNRCKATFTPQEYRYFESAEGNLCDECVDEVCRVWFKLNSMEEEIKLFLRGGLRR